MSEFSEWGLWQYRASVAQANAGGGAIVLDFPPGIGDTMIVLTAVGANSGTNTLRMEIQDEDNNIGPVMINIASGAATTASIPRGEPLRTTGQEIDTTDYHTRMLRGDNTFVIRQTGTGAQNDTLIVLVTALISGPTPPTVSKARSSNPSDVTITPTENKVL